LFHSLKKKKKIPNQILFYGATTPAFSLTHKISTKYETKNQIINNEVAFLKVSNPNKERQNHTHIISGNQSI
jgi:hypothetical protein